MANTVPPYHMQAKITVDKAGRVVIPKPMRDKLHLVPGDALELESAGEEIVLRPLRSSVPLCKEKGVWVFRTGRPLAAAETDSVLREIRDGRDASNLLSE